MKKYLDGDTIVAISTPVGKSGIGIVRLSGRGALLIGDKIFRAANGKRPSTVPSHTLLYGRIVEKKEVVDEVLLSVMRAPRTYTREDIVEINCHSGIVVLKKILDIALENGARLASPGEFTKRAFLNGRIDLAQAEAVLDIINSKTKEALKAALGQLQGKLSRKVRHLGQNLSEAIVQLEAAIDFSDQDIQPQTLQRMRTRIEGVGRDIKALLATAQRGTALREGVSCVICGRPNVGKSSLLNALLKRDRAIVTPVPGTTRDVLEETIELAGVPLCLADTAGIVAAGNLAEKEAVRRSKRSIAQAEIVLFVLDASQKMTAGDRKIARAIAQKHVFVVVNKQDLHQRLGLKEAQKLLPGKTIVGISALKGSGLALLEKKLSAFLWGGKVGADADILVTNLRHAQALKKAQKLLAGALRAIDDGQGAEIISFELNAAQRSLGEIIGQLSNEDLLGRIFGQFCIGK